jgi:hypothetical protein
VLGRRKVTAWTEGVIVNQALFSFYAAFSWNLIKIHGFFFLIYLNCVEASAAFWEEAIRAAVFCSYSRKAWPEVSI